LTPGRAARGWPPRVRDLVGISFALLFVAQGVACGPSSAPPEPPTDPGATLRLGEILRSSWHAAVVREPAALEAMLDGPGGEGWFALFHGDLAGAQDAFRAAVASDPGAAAAHLGLARVALARADALRDALELEERVSPELVTYRIERGDRMRSGRYEPVLAALTLQGLLGAGTRVDEALVRARNWTPAPADAAVAASLRALLAARVAGAPPPPSLPEPLGARVAAAAAVDRFESADLGDGGPDFVDVLGRDDEAGIEFSVSYWDPGVRRARMRAQLLAVIEHGAAAGAAGRPLAEIAAAAWGGQPAPPLPAEVQSALSPALALFGGRWIDLEDLRASWDQGGRSLLVRLDQLVPDEQLRRGVLAADADRVLRFESRFVGMANEALLAAATEEGRPLVRELELPRLLADQLLRQRARELVADGHPIHALRLAERSLGVAAGKADPSGVTRLSHRNDAAFLVHLAILHAASGRPGVAREYVHPLSTLFPGQAAVSYALGQLDAASSIGVQGKTSQQ
jgi:hypothetical protein